jgi:hypothetical protein
MRLPADAVRCAHPLLAALGTLAALAHPVVTLAVGMGRWTPKFDWASTAESDRRTAVHMMLLRGDGVRSVRPGVYVYRLVAGHQRAQKTMVVVP